MHTKIIIYTILFLLLPMSITGKETHAVTPGKAELEFSYSHHNIDEKKLPKKYKNHIKDIIKNYSIYRRIESVKFNTDKFIYHYLLNNVTFAVKISEGIRISKYLAKKGRGDHLFFNDRKGVLIRLKRILRTKNMIMYYGEGIYKGRVIKRLAGDVLVILKFSVDDKKNMVESDIGFYMKFESGFMNTAIKMASYLFNPILKKRAAEYMTVAKTINELIKEDPARVYALLQKNKIVTAGELRAFKRVFLK